MKVLIVEDSIDFAKPLLDFFKIDGHNTEHSDNLANAEAFLKVSKFDIILLDICLLYTSPSPRDAHESRMPSSA